LDKKKHPNIPVYGSEPASLVPEAPIPLPSKNKKPKARKNAIRRLNAGGILPDDDSVQTAASFELDACMQSAPFFADAQAEPLPPEDMPACDGQSEECSAQFTPDEPSREQLMNRIKELETEVKTLQEQMQNMSDPKNGRRKQPVKRKKPHGLWMPYFIC